MADFKLGTGKLMSLDEFMPESQKMITSVKKRGNSLKRLTLYTEVMIWHLEK